MPIKSPKNLGFEGMADSMDDSPVQRVESKQKTTPRSEFSNDRNMVTTNESKI